MLVLNASTVAADGVGAGVSAAVSGGVDAGENCNLCSEALGAVWTRADIYSLYQPKTLCKKDTRK